MRKRAKVESLMESLRERLTDAEWTTTNMMCDELANRTRWRSTKQLVEKLRIQIESERLRMVTVDRAQQDLTAFRLQVRSKQNTIDRLRDDTRRLMDRLPDLRTETTQLKATMLDQLQKTRITLEDLVSLNPMQRLLALLQPSIPLTGWLQDSYGSLVRALQEDALYEKCCAPLHIHPKFQYPDIVLKRADRFVLDSRLASLEAEWLRESADVLNEEYRTTLARQKHDARLQEKVLTRVQPSMDRVRIAMGEVRIRMDKLKAFITDWQTAKLMRQNEEKKQQPQQPDSVR